MQAEGDLVVALNIPFGNSRTGVAIILRNTSSFSHNCYPRG